MANLISDSFVRHSSANIYDLVEREGSILMPYVTKETSTGDRQTIERIGSIDISKVVGRNAPTNLVDPKHSRRTILVEDYAQGVMLDHQDNIKTLIDPMNNYAKKLSQGLGRAIDDAIIKAALGTALAGNSGGTNVVLPAASKIAAGGTGLTFAKLLSVKEKFLQQHHRGGITGIVTSAALMDMLNETKVTSSDYNMIKGLVSGEVDTFLGIKFVVLDAPELVDNNKTLFFGEGALHLFAADGINVSFKERADMNDNVQVLIRHSFGAGRLEEELVCEVSYA